jgi:predicted nucleotidyltransferase
MHEKMIKKTVLNTAKKYDVQVERIILFGSRARGDYKEDSDWDILIVTENRLDDEVKYRFIYDVRKEIVWKADIPIDVIVVDREQLESYRDVHGSIVGIACLEGTAI